MAKLTNSFRWFDSSPEVIRLMVLMYVKYPQSLRNVDREDEVMESFVTRTRDKPAALKFIKKAMKRHGRPKVVVTDRLRSYKVAMKPLGNAEKQVLGRRLSNRAENSHLPFRRRERAMLRFRRMKPLQSSAPSTTPSTTTSTRTATSSAETISKPEARPPLPNGTRSRPDDELPALIVPGGDKLALN